VDGAAGFFLFVLVLQLVFTGGLMWIVARRFPRRARAYRFVAPAALPVLMFVYVAQNYIEAYRAAGIALTWGPLGRIALAYAVLWFVGVLWATLVLRVARR
jgi:hypothetical protein